MNKISQYSPPSPTFRGGMYGHGYEKAVGVLGKDAEKVAKKIEKACSPQEYIRMEAAEKLDQGWGVLVHRTIDGKHQDYFVNEVPTKAEPRAYLETLKKILERMKSPGQPRLE